jgi:hypothetical protein
MGLASVELVRLLNAHLSNVPGFDFDAVVAVGLSRGILGRRRSEERPITLDRRGRRLAARWNGRTRRSVRAHGVRVVGDLDDLPTRPDLSGVPAELPRPSLEEVLDAADTARLGLQAWAQQLQVTPGDPDGAPALSPPRDLPADGPPPPWLGQPDPLASALEDLTGLVRTCVRLHQAATGASPSGPA